MKKHIFIFVRYSVLTVSNSNHFVLGRDKSISEYRSELFSDDRLKVHDFLFSEVALRSIAAQKDFDLNCGFSLVVLTSEALPNYWMDRLRGHLAPYPWAKIICVDVDGSIERSIKQEIGRIKDATCYATVRLDDDDALSYNFLKKISQYIQPLYNNYIVSYGLGYEGLFDLEEYRFKNINEMYFPKVSAGMTKINIYSPGEEVSSSIYGSGNHAKIDRYFPVIIDSREPSVFRSAYAYQDTKGAGYEKRNKKSKCADPVSVKNFFDIESVIV